MEHLAEWNKVVKSVRDKNPEMSFKDALVTAKAFYKKPKKSKKEKETKSKKVAAGDIIDIEKIGTGIIGDLALKVHNVVRKRNQKKIPNLRLLTKEDGLLHAPHSNYVGPKTNLADADKYGPTSKVDEIAKQHDYDYDKVEKNKSELSKEEVYNLIHSADKRMLERLEQTDPNTPDYTLAKRGIQAKYLLEDKTKSLMYGGKIVKIKAKAPVYKKATKTAKKRILLDNPSEVFQKSKLTEKEGKDKLTILLKEMKGPTRTSILKMYDSDRDFNDKVRTLDDEKLQLEVIKRTIGIQDFVVKKSAERIKEIALEKRNTRQDIVNLPDGAPGLAELRRQMTRLVREEKNIITKIDDFAADNKHLKSSFDLKIPITEGITEALTSENTKISKARKTNKVNSKIQIANGLYDAYVNAIKTLNQTPAGDIDTLVERTRAVLPSGDLYKSYLKAAKEAVTIAKHEDLEFNIHEPYNMNNGRLYFILNEISEDEDRKKPITGNKAISNNIVNNIPLEYKTLADFDKLSKRILQWTYKPAFAKADKVYALDDNNLGEYEHKVNEEKLAADEKRQADIDAANAEDDVLDEATIDESDEIEYPYNGSGIKLSAKKVEALMKKYLKTKKKTTKKVSPK